MSPRLLLVTLLVLALPCRAEEPSYRPAGGPLPVAATPLVLEHLDVALDLTSAPPGSALVRLGAALHNPELRMVSADLMILTGGSEPARVRVNGYPVEVATLLQPFPRGGLELPGEEPLQTGQIPVTLFQVQVAPGGRAHLLAELVCPGMPASADRGARYHLRLPAASGWAAVEGTVALARIPPWLAPELDPPLEEGQGGPGYLCFEGPLEDLGTRWLSLEVKPRREAVFAAGLVPGVLAGLLGLWLALARESASERPLPQRAAVWAGGAALVLGALACTLATTLQAPALLAEPDLERRLAVLSLSLAPILTAAIAATAVVRCRGS